MNIVICMIIIIISHLHQQKLVHEESYTEKECQLQLVNSQHNQSICSCMYMHAYYIHALHTYTIHAEMRTSLLNIFKPGVRRPQVSTRLVS